MNLPKEVDTLSDSFKELPAARKAEIIEHLKTTSEGRRNATLATLLANGGKESAFVRHIFGKDVPEVGESPNNKKINPPQTKAMLPPLPPGNKGN